MKIIHQLPFVAWAVPALALSACAGKQQTQAQSAPANDPGYGSTLNQPTETSGGAPESQSSWSRDSGRSQGASEPTRGPTRATDPTHAESSASSATTGSSGTTTTSSGATETHPLGEAPTDTVGGSGDTPFDDAQIGAVLHTLNRGEVAEAQLAEHRAHDAKVKRFAQHMDHAHTAMQNEGKALLSRIHVTPSDNVVSNQLKSQGDSELSSLQGDHGHDFDVAYMDAQVKGHRHALTLVDQMLASVKNDDLRAELQGARTKIDQHLQEAEGIQRDLK